MPGTLSKDGLTPIQRLIRLLSQYRKEIRYVVIYAVVVGLINLSLPLGVQAIIGLIAGGSMAASWGVLVLFILVGALSAGLLRLAQLSLMENLQRRIFTDSSMEFALRIPRLHLDRLRREHLPELVNRFFDTLTIQKGLPKLLIDGSTAILQIFFSLVLLSFYNPSFVLFSLLLLLGMTVLFWWTGPKGLQTSLVESKYKYKLAFWLEEIGRVATTFQLSGENRFPVQRADELTSSYLDARSSHWRILVIQFVSSIAFRVLLLGGFLILGSILVMNNQLNIGQFVASEILVLYVIDSIDKLISLHETGFDILTAIEKIGQVTDLPLEREDGVRVEEFCDEAPFNVELRNLSYRYDDGEVHVLNSIDLQIPAASRLAITGYNGSGKSTLLQILAVLRRDFSGILLFNGLPKQNLNLRSLRQHVGDFSPQEDIFKGTIEENITLGRTGIGLNHLLQVIEQVGLSEFIRNNTKGIHTELLPGGKSLAKSVVTKVLVARAIISRPKMLVMEEPLHFLNLRDRIRIAQLLTDPKQPWTLVCVTDDPVLAALCDTVVVMENGAIIEKGGFEDIRNTIHYTKVFRVNDENER